MQPKAMLWLGDSLEAVKDFSAEARREAGHQLGRVQTGEEPTDWKSMETVGAGVREIRVRVEKAEKDPANQQIGS
jgi:phage-related protein